RLALLRLLFGADGQQIAADLDLDLLGLEAGHRLTDDDRLAHVLQLRTIGRKPLDLGEGRPATEHPLEQRSELTPQQLHRRLIRPEPFHPLLLPPRSDSEHGVASFRTEDSPARSTALLVSFSRSAICKSKGHAVSGKPPEGKLFRSIF